MPFECQVCATEKKNAGANVCPQCDNMVCQDCWKNWCGSEANRGRLQVPCPFCRAPAGRGASVGATVPPPAPTTVYVPVPVPTTAGTRPTTAQFTAAIQNSMLPSDDDEPEELPRAGVWVLPPNVRAPLSYRDARPAEYWERRRERAVRESGRRQLGASAQAAMDVVNRIARIYRVEADGSQVPADALAAERKPGACKWHTRDFQPCRYKGVHNGYCRRHEAAALGHSAATQ